jgi:hypothetical protein
MVSPLRGLTDPGMGRDKTIQPLLDEKGIRPTLKIKQPKPRSVYRSRNESLQHANGPNARFSAPPYGVRRSDLLSRRHYRRCRFRLIVHSSSIFLRALRSTRVTRLHRYYGRSDFCLAVLRILTAAAISPPRETAVADKERRSVPDRSLCVMCFAFRLFSLQSSDNSRDRFLTLSRHEQTDCCFGLRHWLAGSPICLAESSSLTFGTGLCLPMLSTPPRGDAVSVDYKIEGFSLKRTCTFPAKPHLQTH